MANLPILFPREYQLWSDILHYCNQPENHSVVCGRWLSFANFLVDLPYLLGYNYWKNNLDTHLVYPIVFSVQSIIFDAPITSEERAFNRTWIDNKFNLKPILCSNGKIYLSQREASKALNISYSYISKCINGTRKHCKGYTFEYLEVNK